MRTAPARSFLGFWMMAVLAQLAGDAAFYLAVRPLRESVAGLDLRVAQLNADSLHRAVSQYLRDSLGVTTTRRNDTLVVIVPPTARRSIDASAGTVAETVRRSSGWLVAGLVLLHIPLLLAAVVTLLTLRDRAREERNLALREWRDVG